MVLIALVPGHCLLFISHSIGYVRLACMHMHLYEYICKLQIIPYLFKFHSISLVLFPSVHFGANLIRKTLNKCENSDYLI